jgi:hypothetical protein
MHSMLTAANGALLLRVGSRPFLLEILASDSTRLILLRELRQICHICGVKGVRRSRDALAVGSVASRRQGDCST